MGKSILERIIPETKIRALCRQWIMDDTPFFDAAAVLLPDTLGGEQSVNLVCKANSGRVAGIPIVELIFDMLGCKFHRAICEGMDVDGRESPTLIGTITGKPSQILAGERLALNILARASGVATGARNIKNMYEAAGGKAILAATRKTTPGFGLVEKYGVLIGGCDTYRMSLSDMVMIKDNHAALWALCESGGSLRDAIALTKQCSSITQKIEIETSTEASAFEAAHAGADIVMLDNFRPEEAKQVADKLKATFPQLLINVSGNINPTTILDYCDNNSIDIITMGYLTQGYNHVDFSVRVIDA